MRKSLLPIIIFSLFAFGCSDNGNLSSDSNSDSKNIIEKSESFGWNADATLKLRKDCYERFRQEAQDEEILNKEDYCDCFVNKIITSVKYKEHTAPNEKTMSLYDKFSKNCLELTTVHEGVLYE